MTYHHGQKLGTKLIELGLCPKNANNIELHIPADGAVWLKYEVFLETVDLPKLVEAIASLDPKVQADV